MSESGSGWRGAVSGYVRQVGRGLVYLFILQYSVGIAIRVVLERAVGPVLIPRIGVVSAVGVAVVAAILVNRPNPPSYRRLTAFTLVSLVVGFTVDRLVGLGDGHVGALYPTLQAILLWLGTFLLAYAVVFEVDWRRFLSAAGATDAE